MEVFTKKTATWTGVIMVTIKDIDDTQITFSEGTLTNVEADAGGYLRLAWAVDDSHEDGNISEYTATGGTWEVKNTGARTGTYAVSGSSGRFDAATDTGAHTWDALYRGNFSPPLYIEQWHYFPVTTAAQNLGISFGVSGVQDFYYLRYDPVAKPFGLSKIVAGVETVLASNTAVAAQIGWLRFTVLWEADGSITAKMYNSSGTLLITLGPVIDTTFSSGGAGMVVAQGSTDGAVRFDDLKIRDVTSGNRISPQLDLSAVGMVESSSVSWRVETPLYLPEVSASGTSPQAYTTFGPINLSGLTKANGYLSIELKCSNWSDLSGNSQIEITSSGSFDVEEWSYNLASLNITSSYKTFLLPLSDFGTTGGELVVSEIDFIRFYANFNTTQTISWRNAKIIDGPVATIETRTSTDNGTNWTAWKTCTNGEAIPDLPYGTDASTALLECRQNLSTSDPTVTPRLESITVEVSGEFGSFFAFPF